MSDTLFNHPLALLVVIGLPAFGILAKLFGQSFERIAKWYLYISVFAVVVVMDSIFFPFIGGKDWFFRWSIELALVAFLFWWAFEAKDGEVEKFFKETFRRPLVIAVSVFAFVVLLSSIFAFDIHAAFWSNYERGEGLFQMLHYFVFFVLLAVLLRTERDWKRIFGFFLTAACLMIGYGFLANLGTPTFIGPVGGGVGAGGFFAKLLLPRFQGALGNPAYVAPYLIFAMFFAVGLWIMNRKTAKAPVARHWGYGILVAVFLLFFFLSQTRGAFIGLGAGLFVLLVYLAFAGRAKLKKVSLSILAVLIVLGAVGFAVRNLPAVQNLPEGRLLQLSFSDSTAQTRFWVWGEAWQGFLERPVLGWGQENFTAVYDKFFNPNFYTPGQPTETWFDRAHSVFFDYLAETGILGLLAYLAIFVVFYVEFFKVHRRGRDHESTEAAPTILRGLVFALPVAYLIQGAAIFDVLPMYIPLFLFLGFATYYFNNHEKISNH
jgi:O-antigen ligase